MTTNEAEQQREGRTRIFFETREWSASAVNLLLLQVQLGLVATFGVREPASDRQHVTKGVFVQHRTVAKHVQGELPFPDVVDLGEYSRRRRRRAVRRDDPE